MMLWILVGMAISALLLMIVDEDSYLDYFD